MQHPLLLVLPLLGAGSPATSQDSGPWVTEIIFQAPAKLGACAIGDVDPTVPGNEVVSTCQNGELYVSYRKSDGSGWRTVSAGSSGGEKIQVAIGDALPSRPGMEIVACGALEGPEADEAPGAATLYHHDGASFQQHTLLQTEQLLHAVTIVDDRVLLAGYDEQLLVARHGAGAWSFSAVADLPGPAKCLTSHGNTSYMACKDGSVLRLRRGLGDDYELEFLHQRNVGRARLGTDGREVIVCDDDGKLHLVDRGGSAVLVHEEVDKLRGAVIADLDTRFVGSEIATAGYERRLSIIQRRGASWVATPVLVETEKFHGLAAGQLDDDRDMELVACGYSGRLVLVQRHERAVPARSAGEGR